MSAATAPATTERIGTRRIAHEIGPPLAGVAGLVAVWALIAALTTTDGVPSPLDAWRAFLEGVRDAEGEKRGRQRAHDGQHR